jgi:N-acyl-D-aspartate/D-glutamate deacylase
MVRMVLTASKLREDIYRVLDHVLATGEPVEIERNGRRLRIVADEPPSKLARLVARPDVVNGDSDDFVHLDWSDEWSG